jgi:hypothetical protein
LDYLQVRTVLEEMAFTLLTPFRITANLKRAAPTTLRR